MYEDHLKFSRLAKKKMSESLPSSERCDACCRPWARREADAWSVDSVDAFLVDAAFRRVCLCAVASCGDVPLCRRCYVTYRERVSRAFLRTLRTRELCGRFV